MTGFRTILVPTDFSAHSAKAVDQAVEMAKAFGSTLHLVHAFNVPVPFVTPYEVAIPENFLEQARDSAKQRLESVRERVQGAGVEVKAHLTEVPAAPAIARVAEELGADLIVMGTRGNTGLKHVILGSVAERVIRQVDCPVLTVKEEDAA